MKSCCFGGPNDEFVLSGSDDFNLYMWQISDDETSWQDRAHLVLRGHRSIVNQGPTRFINLITYRSKKQIDKHLAKIYGKTITTKYCFNIYLISKKINI